MTLQRTLTVKLIVPRQAGQLSAAQHLWRTHAAVNAAVEYYTNCLLEMRGQGYETAQGHVSKPTVTTALLQRVRQGQVANGHEPCEGCGDEALQQHLRALYAAMVPSAEQAKGSAQQARGFLAPLTDPKSIGLQRVFTFLEQIPPWVQPLQDREAAALEAAYKWLQTHAGQQLLQTLGGRTQWGRLARANDPAWPHAFVTDVERKRREAATGPPMLVRQLNAHGVLPLFRPYLAPRIASAKGALSPWDHLAFRLAIGHLLAWETQCHQTAQTYLAHQERLATFEAQYGTDAVQAALTALQAYETQRQQDLMHTGLAMQRPFRITARMLRGWPDLRRAWHQAPDHAERRLLAIIAQEQTRQRHRFGDPDLFRWLAKPNAHAIWSDSQTDAVSILVKRNELANRLERARPTALLTLPHPQSHPRWVQWEGTGSGNIKRYRLTCTAQGHLMVTLPVLQQTGPGQYEEGVLQLPLAPSGQLQSVGLQPEGTQVRVTYRNGGGAFSGNLGAADLRLKRHHLDHRSEAALASGEIGPAWLAITVDLAPQLPEAHSTHHDAIRHFFTPWGQRLTHQQRVQPGLRVLAVDLGLRTFAACSVYELCTDRPEHKAAFPVEELGCWAVHERSFQLALPNECVGAEGIPWQQLAWQELQRLRRTLNRYREVRLLAALEPAKRAGSLERLLTTPERERWPFEPPLYTQLRPHLATAQIEWVAHVEAAAHAFRHAFGLIVQTWRRQTHTRESRKHLGQSLWAIDYLTRVRTFLQGWNRLGGARGDIRRLDQERQGHFADRLQAHINHLKRDRCTTGADLIVQAARGYQRDTQGQWCQSYAPCHLILFEALSRYRMQTDRPRRENSRLMQWSHRAIRHEVEMQGEPYGLWAGDIWAAYSSRYHARSGTPGIRGHSLTESDLRNTAFLGALEQEHPELHIMDLRPGMVVPKDDGTLFVYCTPNGGVAWIDADINAAQNLQQRFWTHRREVFTLRAQQSARQETAIWELYRPHDSLIGTLGGRGHLECVEPDQDAWHWVLQTTRRNRRREGEEADVEVLEDDEELDRLAKVQAFFRDPSGVVCPSLWWFPRQTFWQQVQQETKRRLPACAG